jgi:lysophospholipase L1-like esterase
MKLLTGTLITLALVLQSGSLSAQQGLGGAGQALPSSLLQCPDVAAALTAVTNQDTRLRDWANLARYREANRTVNGAGVVFMGDSITDFWRGSNPPYDGKAVFDKYFSQWTVANFGIAGDTTQGVLYRLQDGEGKGFTPKAIMLMIGTNNRLGNTAAEIAEGVGAVVLALQQDFPNARILLLGVFPTGAAANDPARATIAEINKIIAKLNDGTRVRYLDIGKGFLDADGNIPADVMSDALHPTAKGYEIWAKAVIEPLSALMGTPVPSVK